MWSSLNDFSSLGRHIFNNTLLTRPVTQRWIRPVTPVSDIKGGIGAPWGLRRLQIGDPATVNRIVDAYGKAGSINTYQSLMILIPDYEVGITALLAGEWPGNANWHMSDIIGAKLIPALEEVAREQAGSLYGGKYTYTSEDVTLNSTVTFTTDPNKPGLGVENWISNGTDSKCLRESTPIRELSFKISSELLAPEVGRVHTHRILLSVFKGSLLT